MNVTRSRNHHTPAKTPSRFNPNVPTTAQANVNYDRRDSMLNGTPSQLSDSPSLSSGSRIPTTEGSSTLPGVPEKFAVQEFAFRQGQQDHGVVSGHIPPSPFAECFDNVWTEHYLRGKAAGGKPRKASDYPPTPSLQGMDTWSVFVNPYTQDLQNPDGSVDMRYMKGICINAVKAMRTCIVTVCRRKGRDEWKKIVCDVPMQVQHALGAFPELQDEYEQLRADASEALGGGLPMGYHGGHR